MDSAVTIRRAGRDDAEVLSLVGGATFLETFAGLFDGADIVEHCRTKNSVETYRQWLGSADARVWIAEAPHGAPVGYLVLDRADLPLDDLSPTDYEVRRIYLLRRFQGSRIGARLMQLAIDEARALGATRLLLGVYARNVSAIGFYERMGFSRAGRRAFFVGHTECEDHILARPIGSAGA